VHVNKPKIKKKFPQLVQDKQERNTRDRNQTNTDDAQSNNSMSAQTLSAHARMKSKHGEESNAEKRKQTINATNEDEILRKNYLNVGVF